MNSIVSLCTSKNKYPIPFALVVWERKKNCMILPFIEFIHVNSFHTLSWILNRMKHSFIYQKTKRKKNKRNEIQKLSFSQRISTYKVKQTFAYGLKNFNTTLLWNSSFSLSHSNLHVYLLQCLMLFWYFNKIQFIKQEKKPVKQNENNKQNSENNTHTDTHSRSLLFELIAVLYHFSFTLYHVR